MLKTSIEISELKMARYTNIELQHLHRVNLNFYLFEPKMLYITSPILPLLAYFYYYPISALLSTRVLYTMQVASLMIAHLI
ncbi:hypothetical protein CWC24_06870 [Pseudoalteromonas ruthenica]|nr:hypothetical protein CWC24_06870 [Pseudoalteromonas ruthenica]TMO52752.1 hypothetical protein CWC23_01765 [Pseudoalteromonas ruthenica]